MQEMCSNMHKWHVFCTNAQLQKTDPNQQKSQICNHTACMCALLHFTLMQFNLTFLSTLDRTLKFLNLIQDMTVVKTTQEVDPQQEDGLEDTEGNFDIETGLWTFPSHSLLLNPRNDGPDNSYRTQEHAYKAIQDSTTELKPNPFDQKTPSKIVIAKQVIHLTQVTH